MQPRRLLVLPRGLLVEPPTFVGVRRRLLDEPRTLVLLPWRYDDERRRFLQRIGRSYTRRERAPGASTSGK